MKQTVDFNIVQAADRLGLTRQRIYQLIHGGQAPGEADHHLSIPDRRRRPLDALIAERAAGGKIER